MTRARCRCLTLTATPTPGEMPLHKLSRQGCLEATRGIIDILIKTDSVKIDLNWQDKQGKTPIFYAAEYGHTKLVQLFLDRGADPLVGI